VVDLAFPGDARLVTPYKKSRVLKRQQPEARRADFRLYVLGRTFGTGKAASRLGREIVSEGSITGLPYEPPT
jgi:hypothetical protein